MAIFGFIIIISLILLIIGLFKPYISLFWYKGKRTIQFSIIFYASIAFISLITYGIIAEFTGDAQKYRQNEREKNQAQLQVQTAIEKEKHDARNRKLKETQKVESENKKELEDEKEIILPKYKFLEKRQMRGGGIHSFVLVVDTLCVDVYLELMDNIQYKIRSEDQYTENKLEHNYNIYLYSSEENYNDDHKTNKTIKNMYFFSLEGVWEGYRRTTVKYNYGHSPKIKKCK
jgi:hypothetical protein